MNDNMTMRQVDAAELQAVEGGNFIGALFHGIGSVFNSLGDLFDRI